MSEQTRNLLNEVLEAVERCYAASNHFTDETRAQLLAGARNPAPTPEMVVVTP